MYINASAINFSSTMLHGNFVWTEDATDDTQNRRWNTMLADNDVEDLPVSFPRFYNNYNYHRRVHLSALVPFGIMFVLSTIIFIMIIFRRCPGMVSGIIAGMLTFASIYILLLTLKEEVLVYE